MFWKEHCHPDTESLADQSAWLSSLAMAMCPTNTSRAHGASQ